MQLNDFLVFFPSNWKIPKTFKWPRTVILHYQNTFTTDPIFQRSLTIHHLGS